MDELKNNEDMQSNLSEDDIRQIMGKLFLATEYLHRNNVCHRDLKPDNIIITKLSDLVYRVMIIDFNVSVEVNPDTGKIRGWTGLREWSAPETRLKLNDYKIDCWTLGCIFYYLCTGEQPFGP